MIRRQQGCWDRWWDSRGTLVTGLASCLLAGCPPPPVPPLPPVSCTSSEEAQLIPSHLGIGYGPFRQHERPFFKPKGSDQLLGLQPLRCELEEDADILTAILPSSRKIRVYSSRYGPGDAASVLAERGFAVTLGVYVDEEEPGDSAESEAEIQSAIDLLERFPDRIVRIVVGNETQLPLLGEMPEPPLVTQERLIELIRDVKVRVNGRIPVTVAEVFSTWVPSDGQLNEDLVREVDEIMVHIYGYWDSQPVGSSVDYIYEKLEALRVAVMDRELERPIVLGETGWPVGGRTMGEAVPGGLEQRQFLCDLFSKAHQQPEYEVFVFEAFSEPWKAFLDDDDPAADRPNVEDKWGLLTSCRELQEHLRDLFPAPPQAREEGCLFRVFHRGQLSPGHGLGVSSNREKEEDNQWTALEQERLVIDFPADYCWGSVFITRGKPADPKDRVLAWDLTPYSHLVAVLSGTARDGSLELAIKDLNDPDDGGETKLWVNGLSATPQALVVPLAAFDEVRPVDRARVYVDASFSFVTQETQSVLLSELYYLPSGFPTPPAELGFEVISRPAAGDAQVFVGGCVNRWLTLRAATASGSVPDGIIEPDSIDAEALCFNVPVGEDFASVFFHVGEPQGVPRSNFQDFSMFSRLVFDVRGLALGNGVFVGIKDWLTEGAGHRVALAGSDDSWREVVVDLDSFFPTDRRRLSVVFEFVVTQSVGGRLCFRNVRLE